MQVSDKDDYESCEEHDFASLQDEGDDQEPLEPISLFESIERTNEL